MARIKVPCPECGSGLRIPDRSYLGRRGKCPKCSFVFVLQIEESPAAEEEVVLTLAENTPATPPVGTAAQWVPDTSTAQSANATPAPIDSGSQAGTQRLREIRRKNKQRLKISGVLSSIVLVLAVGSYLVVRSQRSQAKSIAREAPQRDVNYESEKKRLERNVEESEQFSPTKGKPLKLPFIPLGSRIVINLRSAELWSEESRYQELMACLGPVKSWLESEFVETCLYEPSQIEQATICIILGAQSTPPIIAATVRMLEPIKKSEWLEKSAGLRNDDYGYPVYLAEKKAYLLGQDGKTFGVGPLEMVSEMVDAATFDNPISSGIEELIKETDSDRHVTVVFQPQDLRIHQEMLVADNVRDILNHFVDWLGDDVESAAWSLHFGDKLHSELLLRNHNSTHPARLQSKLRKRLDVLPEEVYSAVEMMRPQQLGPALIIGRLPAMLNAVRHGTRAGIGPRFVQLTTVLHERATPNLAMASLLAWDESTRTDFDRVPVESEKTSNLPALLADRLKFKIEADFRRTPLQEAFAYIAGETKVKIALDGDALKLAGYTKNMPQTFSLGTVPAEDVIRKILTQYDAMCVVVDEKSKLATVMTKSVAKSKNLKPAFP
jgi:hypothetical protein